MTQERAPYISNTGDLSGFSEEVKGILQLIKNNATGEVVDFLVQYVAAFVHPDYICNLSTIDKLTKEAKSASLSFFNYCLSKGLSVEEQSNILKFLHPYMVQALKK